LKNTQMFQRCYCWC